MLDATFTCPDLSTFAGLDELGLLVCGQRLEPDRAVLACQVADPDDWCHRWRSGHASGHGDPGVGARAVRVAPHGLGSEGAPVPVRRLGARVAPKHRPRRTSPGKIAPPGVGVGAGGADVPTPDCSHVAESSLGVSWNTANEAVLAEGQHVLIDDAARFDGVGAVGVDDSPARRALKREVPPACGATPAAETST